MSIGNQVDTAGQTSPNIVYLPIVNNTRSGWIGPYGGSVVAIAVDPTNPSIVYVGTYGTGVYKSQDGGTTWVEVNNGLGNLLIISMAVDPKNPLNVFAGSYKNQIYKSSDGGNSWSWSGTGMQDQAIIYSIAVDPISPNVIYASTRGQSNNGNPPWKGVIYKTSNGGNSWSPSLENIGSTQDWAYSLVVNPNKNQQVFAAFHENGAWRSDNSGVSWGAINNGVTDYSGRSIVISPQLNFSSRLYYGVWHDDAVFITNNSGGGWNWADNGVRGANIYSLVIDPTDPNTVYASSYSLGIYKTSNAGNLWTLSGLQSDRCYNVTLNPKQPSIVYAGTAGDGIYRSTNAGASWQRSSAGINGTTVTAVAQSTVPYYSLLSSTYGAGIFRSVNYGMSWDDLTSNLPDRNVHDLVVDPGNPNLVYALTDTSGLYRYDLSNANGWIQVSQGLPLNAAYQTAYPADHPFVTFDTLEGLNNPISIMGNAPEVSAPLIEMVYAPSNPSYAYMATSGKGVYKSSNGGSSWSYNNLGGQIRNLAIDYTDANVVYAVTDSTAGIYYTSNGGSNWNMAALPANFYSLATSPTAPGLVYVGTNNGIYRYQAGIFTSLGLNGQSVTAILANPQRPGVIYAGTSSGAYYTTNNGATWNTVDDRLNGQTIMSISFDQAQPNIGYFTTKAHGTLLGSLP